MTQGSLRVALGYILSPPSEAECTVRRVFGGAGGSASLEAESTMPQVFG